MSRTKPDDLSDEDLAKALRIADKTMRLFEIGDSAEIIDPEHKLDEIGYHIVQAADRLQRVEQQRDDYREIIVRLKDALGLQLDGEEFTPEKVADRILDPYDRLQRVEGENRRLRKALRAAHHFIEDEARYQDGQFIIDVADWDWEVPDLDAVLAETESSDEEDG